MRSYSDRPGAVAGLPGCTHLASHTCVLAHYHYPKPYSCASACNRTRLIRCFSHALVAFSRHRSADGHVTLDAFGAMSPADAYARVPRDFRRLFESDSGARVAFFKQEQEEQEEQEEEEEYHDILHLMDTEQFFMGPRQRIVSKVKVMEEEMQFLRDDLAATIRDFGLLVQHLQQTGVLESQDFEMAAPEEPAAWFERRRTQRIEAEAKARLSSTGKRIPVGGNDDMKASIDALVGTGEDISV